MILFTWILQAKSTNSVQGDPVGIILQDLSKKIVLKELYNKKKNVPRNMKDYNLLWILCRLHERWLKKTLQKDISWICFYNINNFWLVIVYCILGILFDATLTCLFCFAISLCLTLLTSLRTWITFAECSSGDSPIICLIFRISRGKRLTPWRVFKFSLRRPN